MKIIVLYLVVYLSFNFLNCSKDKVDGTPVSDSFKNKSGGENTVKTGNTKVQSSLDEVTFTTSDKKEISGSLYYSDGKKDEQQPLVILIHQFNETRSQWQTGFIDSLLNSGFKVLAYDIRGHGKSSKQNGNLEDLLSDPKQAPLDIKAVVEWSKKQKGIDSSRIAAIGTSIGGNVALYAGLNLNLKVPIAISNNKSTFEAYTGYNELMMGRPYFPKIKNVLLVCGSKDGENESGQKWILSNFCEKPCEMKVFDSDKHGKLLLEEKPEINDFILSWLKKYL